MAVFPASPAVAHVHGITPLRCVTSENAGANQTDQTPASAPNGPISGVIPISVGKAPLTAFEDGGFDTPACPAP